MTRVCSNCDIEKPIEQFSFKYKSKGVRNSWCKSCKNVYTRKHYDLNIEKYAKRNKLRREEVSYIVRKLKEATPCADCNKQYPYYVMQFDHRFNKKFEVSRMYGQSLLAVLFEIVKCDIVCANCHAERTHNRL